MKRAKLTITVDYANEHCPDDTTIEALLRDVARLAAGNGMLSGDGEATVESWDCDVTVTDEPDAEEEGSTKDAVRGVWARFRPQAYINDHAVDIDGGYMFDVTMQIEQMGQDKALKIEDHSYGADALWHAYVAARPEKEHDGPFEIEVADAIEKFYGE